MGVFKLNAKTRGDVFCPLIQAWMRAGCLLSQVAHSVIWSSLHLLHNPLESTGSFSHEFTALYMQVRSQFMNWLCLS